MAVGLFFANTLLIFILGTAFFASIFLIISIVLFVKSKKDKREGKNSLKKIGAIVTLIISIFLFIPLIIITITFSISSEIDDIKEKQVIASIENIVIVNGDEWKKGFEYNDKKLVPVNLLMNSEDYKLSKEIGALVKRYTNEYYPLYEVDSNCGYKIYYVEINSFAGGEHYSRFFVDENDYDEVVNYYETAELKIKVCWKSAPKETMLNLDVKSINLDIRDKQEELMKLLHEVLENYSISDDVGTLQKDNDNHMKFRINSIDKVFAIDFDVYTKDNKMEVLFNDDYKVKDEIVEKYKEMLFDLINDSQAELLRGL